MHEPLIAEAREIPLESEEDFREYAIQKALGASVDPDVILHIIKNESTWNSRAVGDMGLTCESTGRPVRARGLVQITECYYPEITDEQAFDPRYSIDFLVEKVKDGHCRSQWSTCPL